MYPAISRTVRLFSPGGLETRNLLRKLEKSQWLSSDQLEVQQLAQIQDLVQHAYDQVPYYRDLYQQIDFHPQDLKSIKDFQSLPFLTKEEVNSNIDRLVNPAMRHKLISNQTGGSTGQPTRFFFEPSFWSWNKALSMRGRGWYGVKEGDKLALVWGAQQDIHDADWKERLKANIKQVRYLNAFHLTEAKMQAFAEMLVRWQPDAFIGYPSALSLFAQYIREHAISGIHPKFIEVTAEKLMDYQRQILEDVFQCKIADSYTSREVGSISFQCKNGGMHVGEGCFLEIVANDQVAQPGQMGEIIVTSLYQFAMPFIRYKINDMGVLEPGPCTCGRGLPVLREVIGRTNDLVVTDDGRFVHGSFFNHLFRVKPEVDRFQVYQPDLHHVEARLICRKMVDSRWVEAVRSELSERLGTGMEISVRIVNEIQLTPAGKHRYVISDVIPQFVG